MNLEHNLVFVTKLACMDRFEPQLGMCVTKLACVDHFEPNPLDITKKCFLKT